MYTHCVKLQCWMADSHSCIDSRDLCGMMIRGLYPLISISLWNTVRYWLTMQMGSMMMRLRLVYDDMGTATLMCQFHRCLILCSIKLWIHSTFYKSSPSSSGTSQIMSSMHHVYCYLLCQLWSLVCIRLELTWNDWNQWLISKQWLFKHSELENGLSCSAISLFLAMWLKCQAIWRCHVMQC